jgi:hypothetical protein
MHCFEELLLLLFNSLLVNSPLHTRSPLHIKTPCRDFFHNSNFKLMMVQVNFIELNRLEKPKHNSINLF